MSVKKNVNLLDNFAGSVNCFLKDGELVPGYTPTVLNRLYFNKDVIFGVYSNAADVYFFSTDERVYAGTNLFTYNTFVLYEGNIPFLIEDFVDGVERAIIISGDTASVYVNGVREDVTMKAEFECGVMHCGRLFAANGLDVWWSGPEGFSDWEEGLGGCGRLSFEAGRGKVLDMVEFNNKVIAVREFGISVLNMQGSPENFSVGFADTDCDRIYKYTAQVVNGKLYFFSESGLKYFDGSSIKPLAVRHKVREPWRSAEYGGRYFLVCKSEASGLDIILCVDTEDGESCIIADHADMIYAKDGINYASGVFLYNLESGGSFSFESEVNFGTVTPKTLTKIELDGSPAIGINNGRFTRTLKSKDGLVRPRMRGKSFKVTINHDQPVKRATAYAEVTDGV